MSLAAVARVTVGAEQVWEWLYSDAETLPEHQRVLDLMRMDRRIPDTSARAAYLLLDSGQGFSFDPPHFVGGFLREALEKRASEAPRIARDFVAFCRLEGDSVRSNYRMTVLGPALAPGRELRLAIGTLRPALGFQPVRLPSGVAVPAVDLHFALDVGAKLVEISEPSDLPASNGQAVQRQVEQRQAQMLAALALSEIGPAQEQLTVGFPRFSGSGGGSGPGVSPPIVVGPSLLAGKLAERLQREARLTHSRDLREQGFVIRRLLLAHTERLRPEDRIIDASIVIEGLTTGGGRKRGRLIGELLGDEASRRSEQLSKARNLILHRAVLPDSPDEAAARGLELARQLLACAVAAASPTG